MLAVEYINIITTTIIIIIGQSGEKLQLLLSITTINRKEDAGGRSKAVEDCAYDYYCYYYYYCLCEKGESCSYNKIK